MTYVAWTHTAFQIYSFLSDLKVTYKMLFLNDASLYSLTNIDVMFDCKHLFTTE